MTATVTSSTENTPTAAPGYSTRTRLMLGWGLSILSAAILFTVWPHAGNLWPLLLVGFVPALIAQYRFLPRKAASTAIFIASIGYWLPLSLPYASFLTTPVAVTIAVALSLIWLPVMAWERRFSERTNYRWFLLQLPLVWTAVEVAFGHNPITGAVFWLPYRAASAPALIQPVSITSTPALTFLILMVNTTIALYVLRLVDKRIPFLAAGYPVPANRAPIATAITVPLLIAWVTSSLLIYQHVKASLGPTVRVAALLTGAEDGIRFEGDKRGASIQETPEDDARNERLKTLLASETRQAAADGATVIVWPEEALGYDVTTSKGDWIGELARDTRATLVVGYMPDSPILTSPNLVAVWHPDGTRDSETYAKQHPVIVQGEAFTPGTTLPTWPLETGVLGAIICFDYDFPDSAPREIVQAGATIVAVPSLDPSGAENLRWQSLVFNAVANRVPMIKSDIAYDATIVNGDGTILAQTVNNTPMGSAGVLVADVNVGPADAPYTKYGGTPFAVFLFVLLGARVVTQIVLWRRARRTATPT